MPLQAIAGPSDLVTSTARVITGGEGPALKRIKGLQTGRAGAVGVRRRCMLALAAWAVCLIGGHAASAQSITYQDPGMNLPAWPHVEFPGPDGGSFATASVASGGNPLSYGRIVQAFNASSGVPPCDPNSESVAHLAPIFFSPASSGAIIGITWCMDSIGLAHGPSRPSSVDCYLVCQQSGTLYFAWGDRYVAGSNTAAWDHRCGAAPLTASSFTDGPGLTHPDFSDTGAPIRFGFYTQAGHPGPGCDQPAHSTTIGYDNFTVGVSFVPPPVTFSDGDFADWTTALSASDNPVPGSSSSILRNTGAGEPAPSLQITNLLANATSIPGTWTVAGAFFRPTFVYWPGFSSPISSIAYEVRVAAAFAGQQGPDGQVQGLAAMQDGHVYVAGSFTTTTSTAWHSAGSPSLTADDFVLNGLLGTPGPAHPDFSRSGGPIYFGQFTTNSTGPGGGGYLTAYLVDNWSITISRDPTGPQFACCVPSVGTCSMSIGSVCPAGSTSLGAGTVCTPNPCPRDCVLSIGDWSPCSAPCGGGTQTRPVTIITPAANGGTCSPPPSVRACNTQPCELACCVPSVGTCDLSQGGVCAPGTVPQGAGSTCSPNPCPRDCVLLIGAWSTCSVPCGGGTETRTVTVLLPALNGGTCSSPPTVRPCNTQACVGACCRGSICELLNPANCSAAAGRYAGDLSACNAPGDATAPCCLADFNGSTIVSVQDIFDFLAAFFAADPRTDFNQSGAISVQDIFDFLAAYFAGCS